MTILITGATGKIARHLIPTLVGRGLEVRAMIHSAARQSEAHLRGARTVLGRFDDAETLRTAVADADTMLLVTPPHWKAAEWASSAIDAAKRAGIRRIVRISALLAGFDGPSDNNRQHGRTDEVLRASGIPTVILRPHFFMQNLLADVSSLRSVGKISAAAGDAKLGMIDVRDIADVAGCALLDSRWDDSTHDLTGPEPISFHEIAKELSDLLGRQIVYSPVTPEALAKAIRDMGLDEWFAQVSRDYLLAYSQGWGNFTSDAVQQISGKPARPFRQFAADVLVPAVQNPF